MKCPHCNQDLVVTLAIPYSSGWRVWQGDTIVAKPANKAAVLRVLSKLGRAASSLIRVYNNGHFITREELER
jgi:hypothetical protein